MSQLLTLQGSGISIDNISLGSSEELYNTLVTMIGHLDPEDPYRAHFEQVRRVCEEPESEEAIRYMAELDNLTATTRQLLDETDPSALIVLDIPPTGDIESQAALVGGSAGMSTKSTAPQPRYKRLRDFHRLLEQYEKHCLYLSQPSLEAPGHDVVTANLQANRTFLSEIDSMRIPCPQPGCRSSYLSVSSLQYHLVSRKSHGLGKRAATNSIRGVVSPDRTPWKCRWVNTTGYRCTIRMSDQPQMLAHVEAHIMRQMEPIKERYARCARCSAVVVALDMEAHHHYGACKYMVKMDE